MRALVPDRAPPAPPTEQEPLANAGRGRLLYVPDVEELLGGRETPAWVLRNFAPEHKLKLGRRPCWWERDALAWIDAQLYGRR